MPDVPNAANPGQIAETTRRNSDARRDDADDLRWIMSTPQGRRFLGHLIYDPARMLGGGVGVTHSTFSQSHATMAANEGSRDIGLRLLACIEAVDFQLALTIRRERHQEAEAMAAQIAAKKEPEARDIFPTPTLDGPAG